jgi:DHA2 family multidrug resistance protein
MDGRTERLTEARPYKHSSRPFAWIGQQVQTQATLLAYIDAFWALAVLSFAADPLALFLRNVKLGEPAAVTH